MGFGTVFFLVGAARSPLILPPDAPLLLFCPNVEDNINRSARTGIALRIERLISRFLSTDYTDDTNYISCPCIESV